jgi:hypothetical protein
VTLDEALAFGTGCCAHFPACSCWLQKVEKWREQLVQLTHSLAWVQVPVPSYVPPGASRSACGILFVPIVPGTACTIQLHSMCPRCCDRCQVEDIKEEMQLAEEKLGKLEAMGGPQLHAAQEAVQAEVQAQQAEVEQQVG